MRRHVVRNLLFAALVVAGGAAIGGILGGGVLAESQSETDPLRTFGQVMSLIEERYPGKAESKEVVESAIQGMLRTLDPHSNYLSPESYNDMREEQRGQFFGLGIQIAKRGQDLTVISPIEDTPADRAGLQAGDIIHKIEGEPTAEMTVQDAVRRLKGPEGSKVTITIRRNADGSEFDVTIARATIKLESLRVAYMISPEVGFVSLSSFTSTTARELDEALARLAKEGMKKLLLDLRDNPGGLLDQAVKVSERFVPEGRMVVYTRGRIAGSDQDYYAEDGGKRFGAPLVVLVNGGSASASEIVSGAVQDHDRGLVVGEVTFGKGLVQRVIPLRNGGALAVTTAKYYTPAGRLIQRDYSDIDEYFLHRGESEADGESPAVDPSGPAPIPVERRETFHTASGRVVYGGGGITPDYEIPTQRLALLPSRMLRDNLIFDFAVRYNAAHPELQRGFAFGTEQVEEFRRFLEQRGFEYEPAAFEEQRDAVVRRLRAQISRVRWGKVEEHRILAEEDPQIQKALSVFDEAARLSKAGASGTPGPDVAKAADGGPKASTR